MSVLCPLNAWCVVLSIRNCVELVVASSIARPWPLLDTWKSKVACFYNLAELITRSRTIPTRTQAAATAANGRSHAQGLRLNVFRWEKQWFVSYGGRPFPKYTSTAQLVIPRVAPKRTASFVAASLCDASQQPPLDPATAAVALKGPVPRHVPGMVQAGIPIWRMCSGGDGD